MTEKDKTADQLASSIAKTKNSAIAAKKAGTRKAAPKKAAPRKTPRTPGKATARSGKATVPAGGYQAGRRIWPD